MCLFDVPAMSCEHLGLKVWWCAKKNALVKTKETLSILLRCTQSAYFMDIIVKYNFIFKISREFTLHRSSWYIWGFYFHRYNNDITALYRAYVSLARVYTINHKFHYTNHFSATKWLQRSFSSEFAHNSLWFAIHWAWKNHWSSVRT